MCLVVLLQMTYASVTTQLMQMLIKYREVMWTVPQRLVTQVRRQYQAEALKLLNTTPVSTAEGGARGKVGGRCWVRCEGDGDREK